MRDWISRPVRYERDPEFRVRLAEAARTGLRWLGVLGVIGAALYVAVHVLFLGRPVIWVYGSSGLVGSVALGTPILVGIVNALLVIASYARFGLQHVRYLTIAAVLLNGSAILYDGFRAGGATVNYLSLVFVASVAAIPFRPRQVLATGVALVGMAVVLGEGTDPAAMSMRELYTHVAIVGVTTLLMVGVSAILYARHRKQIESEQALRESRRLLQQTEHIARVGGWAVDVQSGALDRTPEVSRIFRAGARDLTVDDLQAHFAEEDYQKLRSAFWSCCETGTAFDVELPIETGRGERRWVRIRGEAQYRTRSDGERRVEQVTGALQDVTERHFYEAEIRDREALLRSINENVSEGIYRSTPEHGLVYVNPAFAHLFGYDDPAEMLSVDSPDLYANPEARKALARELEQEGELKGREVRYQRKDGSTFIGRLTTSIVRSEGKIQYYDGVVADITDQKRRERQLREATAAAQAAREDAEEASASKSRYLAGVAHDLRGPLSGIIAYASLLQQRLQAPNAAYAQTIEEAAEQIEDLADRLTQLSRLESGTISLDLEPVDPCEVVRKVTGTLRPLAAECRITLSTDLPEEAVRVVADAGSLRRVIDNLGRNAVKYSDTGDRVVLRVEPGEETVRVVVSDTGPGIAPDFLEQVFEPFTRNVSDREGTGLGLAITRELVEAMGGTVCVDSTEGEGTTFTVALQVPGGRPPSRRDRGDSASASHGTPVG